MFLSMCVFHGEACFLALFYAEAMFLSMCFTERWCFFVCFMETLCFVAHATLHNADSPNGVIAQRVQLTL